MSSGILTASRRSLTLGMAPAIILTLVVGCDNAKPVTRPTPQSPTTSTPAPTPTPTPTPTGPPAATTSYTLTVTASPSCTALPAAALKRTYSVQMREWSDGSVVVAVVGMYDVMVGWGNDAGFTGKRNGNSISFDITDDMFGSDWAMVERIAGVGDMGYRGTATATFDNGKIIAAFNGTFQIGYGSPPVACQASDHRMEFVPTGS